MSRVRSQVDRLIIVDNASAGDRDWLRSLADSNQCVLVLLDENIGVAAAHNVGVQNARVGGANAVLLLDQDSLPAHDMVRQLSAALRELTDAGESVGAVGPRHVDERTGAESPFVRFGYLKNEHLVCGATGTSRTIRCDHLITSGSLIPIETLDRVGGMDDRLFIDNVDTEWCFRALSRGFSLFGVCAASMTHRVGDRFTTLSIPYAHDVVVHSPLRLYYMIRNHLLLYGRSYASTKWKFQDLPRLLFKAVLFATSIPPRRKNSSMILKGLRDGIRRKTGPHVL